VNSRNIIVFIVIVIVMAGIYAINTNRISTQNSKYLADIDGSDTATIVKALNGLSTRGPGIVRALEEKLSSLDPMIRCQAVMLIGVVGTSRHSDLLIPMLENDNNVFVRKDAAIALGKLGGVQVPLALTKRLKDEAEANMVRAAAIRSLGLLGATEAAPAVSTLLAQRPEIPAPVEVQESEPPEEREDSTANMRVAAAEALGRLGTEAGINTLIEAVDETIEPNDRIRVTAAYALGNLLAINHDEEQIGRIVNHLLSAYTDSIGDVRIAAIYSLGKAQLLPEAEHDQVKKTLYQAENDDHFWVRRAAQETLHNLGRLGI